MAPDIDYFPDLEKYEARTRRRLATEQLEQTLPEGFPRKIEGKSVWEGADLDITRGGNQDWCYTFTESELVEIEDALKHFLSLNLALGFINSYTFPLPTLHDRLRAASDEIHNGRGFIVLRGLQVSLYSRKENMIIYAGISSHVGSQRGRQDHEFEGRAADVVVTHIKDLEASYANSIGSPAYTSHQQTFHTDSGDMIGLFMLSCAESGGESQISSSGRIYNELANKRPDLIRTLAEDWVVDRRKAEAPFIRRPCLYVQPGNPKRIVLQCSRGSYTNFGALPRSANIPPITEAQAEALDALHFLAEKFHLKIKMQAGDIQYGNDFCNMHARCAFVDTAQNQRHLLRMWFRDPENGWEVPKPLMTRWKGVYEGVEPEQQIFPLEPHVRSSVNATKIKKLLNV